MQGYNVLHPMGWDAFGLPAEQYAVKTGNHPSGFTEDNIKVFKNEYDYIIIIMKKCDTLDFKQIEDNLLKVIKEKL